jgi:hypothetical protein
MFASGTRGLDARDLAELRRLRRNLDLIRDWCWLMKQKLALERRYRPDQTRVPAGNSDGGRWTREGAGKPSERPGSSNLGSQSRQPARERVRIAGSLIGRPPLRHRQYLRYGWWRMRPVSRNSVPHRHLSHAV